MTTLFYRRQRVQTRRRRTPPFIKARTFWRFGSNRRGVTLCAWLTLRPTTGPLPQISQRFAILILVEAARCARDKHRIIPRRQGVMMRPPLCVADAESSERFADSPGGGLSIRKSRLR